MSHLGKVFVAVSGGVDSAVSTALLMEKGYACQGVFMITHDAGYLAQADAQRICDTLGIKLHVLDFRCEFKTITDYFVNEYKQARTPNPCVLCNRLMKFGKLWKYAQDHGSEFIATGHYARVIRNGNGVGLYQAADQKKDQSYVLSMVNKDVLKHLLLPMSELTKDRTRQIAAKLGLHVSEKSDSQEICFIPDNDYAKLLTQLCPEISQPGNVVNKDGKVLGQHEGVYRYTIGQRRGLGIALGEPAHVIGLDAHTNTVVLGSKDDLLSSRLIAKSFNWLVEIPAEPFEAIVKIRYNHRGSPAVVHPGKDEAEVRFLQPVSAITPGQTVVIYIETSLGRRVVGGGWIEKSMLDKSV